MPHHEPAPALSIRGRRKPHGRSWRCGLKCVRGSMLAPNDPLSVECLHVCRPLSDLATNVGPLSRLSVETLVEHPRVETFCVLDAVR